MTTEQQTLARLEAVLGPGRVLTGPAIPPAAHRDWSPERGGTPLALVAPRDTAEVSAVLRLCHADGIGVVPQGGRTGLAGGAVPGEGTVLLSLAAMNRIEEIDTDAGLMVVEAGCILQTLQEAAAAAGWSLQLDLGARGSAQIGGNIATNAGGNRVIRYGMTRDQVLGLEVVLADGTVLSMMNRMPKNNAALDLKPLFIGSEGTLGVVTRAVLRLRPGVAGANAALVALPGFDAAVKLLSHAQRRLSGRITAFELMWPDYYDAVLREAGKRAPLPRGSALYALVEMQGADPDADAASFGATLETAMEGGLIVDAVLARSQREVDDFWALRDGVAEVNARWSPVINFDVSVPLTRIGACVEEIRAALSASYPALQCAFFGHAGDSNLHLLAGPIDTVDPTGHGIERLVYGIIRAFGGSISAEHGIGMHKKPWLSYSRNAEELALLRRLKTLMDPKGIFNPGKVL
jgi:FAD/FMN-containing dehydrogenase